MVSTVEQVVRDQEASGSYLIMSDTTWLPHWSKRSRTWRPAGQQGVGMLLQVSCQLGSGAGIMASGAGNEHEADRQALLWKMKSSTSQAERTLRGRIVSGEGLAINSRADLIHCHTVGTLDGEKAIKSP
ncbi:hypothetical protein RRG08_037123 [Elysia crispata]|uniref:Uncharacterized protein n=1 Tax=Elysia crispata TaxID=231223 RepID=A0AAE1CSW5_9GAST|nr:hypothetical protein RRG08_037123 [Elysia crispata]